MNTRKPVGSDGMNPKVLEELADVVTKTLTAIFEKSQQSGEVPGDRERRNIVLTSKKGRKENCGDHQPASLTSMPGKVMEQILPEAVLRHMENWSGTASTASPRAIPTNPMAFHDGSGNKGRVTDVLCLDFCKAFEVVPHNSHIWKLKRCGFDGWTVWWTRNWSDGHIQRVIINSSMSTARPGTSGVPQRSLLGPVLFNIFNTCGHWDQAHPQSVYRWHHSWCCWHTWRAGCYPEGPGQAWEFHGGLIMLNKNKCKVLHWDRATPVSIQELGMEGLKRVLQRVTLGHWWMKSWTVKSVYSQPRKLTVSWASSRAAWAGVGRWFCPSTLHLWDHTWGTASSAW